jgi:general secretion pathway protein D
LLLEVSALGENLSADLNDPQIPIRTRTAQSVLTLRDSETVIIGGLIDNTERRSIRKIPGVGDFPAIGSLFSNRSDEATKRDVLMVITPFVIRSQEIPAVESTEIWSGSEDRWSLEAPFGGREEPQYRRSPDKEILELLPAPEAEPAPPVEDAPTPPPPLTETAPLAPETAASVSAPPEPQPPLSDTAPIDPDIAISRTAPESQPVGALTANAETAFGTGWPDNARYSIHVGSYLDRLEAEKRARQLAALDYDCFMIPARIPQKGFFHRIFVGIYADKVQAGDICNQLRSRREFTRDIHVVDRQWAVGS